MAWWHCCFGAHWACMDEDITRPLTVPVIMQYVLVREQVEAIELHPYGTDSVVCRVRK
jgi:hypothetical protein